MASTLMTENQNSSSPNSFTESRLMASSATRAISAVTHCGRSGSQRCT